jgi:metallo-beta-lactamase family protein
MAKLTFLGATGMVTGSKFLLELDKFKFLIDCGLFQGPKKFRLKNWEPPLVDPAKVDRVLLTHAHIDHAGYLPRFCRDGFNGPVHCTHATSDLCDVMLKDSAHLQEEDAAWANKKGYSKHSPALPLYTVEDAEKSLKQFQPLQYGEDLFIRDDLRLKFKDSGHILGSAFIDLKRINGKLQKKIVFSGDIGRPERPILRDPVQVFNVDYLVLESTYGDRLHETTSSYEALARVINSSIERGGVLLIPSFAVGRTQALLYVIRELEEQGEIPSLPVFVDSPMAINATEIFTRRLADHDLASRVLSLQGKKVFQPEQLRVCRSRDDSKAINKVKKKAIIISASGMLSGGRILHHMVARLPKSENTVLFIGYQAMGTRGRALLEGSESLRIHGQEVPVEAGIENFSGFSAHADYNEILAWLMGFNKAPEKTFIVHGEPEASAALADRIRDAFSWDVVVPTLDESFEFDL